MAIYRNREVTVVAPNPQYIRSPESLTVSYKDGTNENVPFNQVQFTQEEKDALIKAYPSRYDNVSVISDEDLKAVRLGITPPSSPELQDQAEGQARQERQQEETRKNLEKAKKDAEKRVDAEVNAPAKTTSNTKVHGDQGLVEPMNRGIVKQAK